jgi:hypothetical protein
MVKGENFTQGEIVPKTQIIIRQYNKGLTELTTPSKARGPITATGADHFIQIGRPDLVAEEIFTMLQKIT